MVRIATVQFPVSGDIGRNARYVRRYVDAAADLGADVVHFSEAALSGYAGNDFETWEGYDWDRLVGETEGVCAYAKERGVWVVLGSAHRLTGERLPHNSLYVINAAGAIVDRYDKRFCTGGDLDYYSPGDHFSVFIVAGVTCGLLICYDVRFPELYRHYKRLGVQCMFHSFWNARAAGANIHTVIMRASLQCRAATNYMWISATNSSARYQSWPGVFLTPDGRIERSLRRHRSGIMVSDVDPRTRFYDAAGPYRGRAMRGVLHSGPRGERCAERGPDVAVGAGRPRGFATRVELGAPDPS